MAEQVELVKVVIEGKANYMTQEEADRLEKEFSKYMKLYPHTEETKKMYDEA